MSKEVIISVDGGGTHTKAVAVTKKGEIVGIGNSGPANHVLSPIEIVRESLKKAIGNAIESAGASLSDVLIISGDTAGIGYLREGAEYVEGIIGEFFPGVDIYLVGDMVAGFFGAIAKNWGVVATAGTGSAIYGRNREGEGLQAGGWGHIMGDEGSAYDIAVKGLRRAAMAFDGRGGPTSLTSEFPKHFGVGDMIQVALTIYLGEGMTRDRIAEAARVVVGEAKVGDEMSLEVIGEAAEGLSLGVVTVARNLNIPADDMIVSYTGSVFLAKEVILDPFVKYIKREFPNAEVLPPVLPTVGGGVRIAFDRLGLNFDDTVDNLTTGLGPQ